MAAVIIAFNTWCVGDLSNVKIWESVVLLVMGIGLDFICKRFRIIGRESHLTVVIFALLTVLVMPILSFKALVAGLVWLVAVYLAFDSFEEPEKAHHHLIYIGISLGVAQTLESFSVFLFIPFFLLFYQNAVSSMRTYMLSVLYFVMVVLCYMGVLFVMEIPEKMWTLLPQISLDYSSFTTPIIRVMLPLLMVLIIAHLLSMRSFPFRYPNRNIMINLLFTYQLVIAAVLVLISSAPGLFILLCLPAAILISVYFTFLQERLSAQALFYAFVVSSLGLGAFFHLWLL